MKSDKSQNSNININSLAKELDEILYMPNSVFIAEDKKEQDDYNLILSFTHFFNNLRDVAIISQLVDSGLKKSKATNNPKHGQLGGMKIFIDNLFFAFILEFIQLMKNTSNKKIISNDLFRRIINSCNKKTQINWKELLNIIYKSDDKLFNTLLKIRNNLSFHYFQPKKIFEGYKIATENSKNKMYISLGSNMASTRYYFFDLANQIAIYKIIENNDFSLDEWGKEIKNLVNLIISVTMNIINKFITFRCAPSRTKTEKLPPISDYLKFK